MAKPVGPGAKIMTNEALEELSHELYVEELQRAYDVGKKDGQASSETQIQVERAMMANDEIADDLRRAYLKGWSDFGPESDKK